MSEYAIGWAYSLSLLGIVAGSTLYWLGGRADKWLRRFVGSFVIALTVNLASVFMGVWKPALIALYPLLAVGFSLGYGGDNISKKVVRRTIYFLGNILSGILFLGVYGIQHTIVLFIIQFIIGSMSIVLGVLNPVYAPVEEGFICMLLNLTLAVYPFMVNVAKFNV